MSSERTSAYQSRRLHQVSEMTGCWLKSTLIILAILRFRCCAISMAMQYICKNVSAPSNVVTRKLLKRRQGMNFGLFYKIFISKFCITTKCLSDGMEFSRQHLNWFCSHLLIQLNGKVIDTSGLESLKNQLGRSVFNCCFSFKLCAVVDWGW